jgi:hypothetical protein
MVITVADCRTLCWPDDKRWRFIQRAVKNDGGPAESGTRRFKRIA